MNDNNDSISHPKNKTYYYQKDHTLTQATL